MARLIFDNLTDEQAETLAEWFEGQGEQDCGPWFENCGVDVPYVDVSRKYTKLGDDLIVHCRES